MKKYQEGNKLRSDHFELISGNTHRCDNCGQPIDLTVDSAGETRDQCPNCDSRDFIKLEGLDECLIPQK